MKTFYAILAVAGAAAAGVVAGVLLAPKKGSDTRDDIVDFLKSHCPLKRNNLEALVDAVKAEIE